MPSYTFAISFLEKESNRNLSKRSKKVKKHKKNGYLVRNLSVGMIGNKLWVKIEKRLNSGRVEGKNRKKDEKGRK